MRTLSLLLHDAKVDDDDRHDRKRDEKPDQTARREEESVVGHEGGGRDLKRLRDNFRREHGLWGRSAHSAHHRPSSDGRKGLSGGEEGRDEEELEHDTTHGKVRSGRSVVVSKDLICALRDVRKACDHAAHRWARPSAAS